jgi:hypothetical protein
MIWCLSGSQKEYQRRILTSLQVKKQPWYGDNARLSDIPNVSCQQILIIFWYFESRLKRLQPAYKPTCKSAACTPTHLAAETRVARWKVGSSPSECRTVKSTENRTADWNTHVLRTPHWRILRYLPNGRKSSGTPGHNRRESVRTRLVKWKPEFGDSHDSGTDRFAPTIKHRVLLEWNILPVWIKKQGVQRT